MATEGVVYKVVVDARGERVGEPGSAGHVQQTMLVRAKNKAQAKNFAAERCITVEPLSLDEGMKLALAGHKVEQVEA